MQKKNLINRFRVPVDLVPPPPPHDDGHFQSSNLNNFSSHPERNKLSLLTEKISALIRLCVSAPLRDFHSNSLLEMARFIMNRGGHPGDVNAIP